MIHKRISLKKTKLLIVIRAMNGLKENKGIKEDGDEVLHGS